MKAGWLRDQDETNRLYVPSQRAEVAQIRFEYESLMTAIAELEDNVEGKVRGASVLDINDLAILDKETNDRVGARDLVITNPELTTERGITSNLLSTTLGCILGRWDICYAISARPVPPLPDPFAPLPACPPGMLQNSQGLPAAPADVPADYPLRIAWDGILVDDPGLGEDDEPHDADIVRRVREALGVLYGEGSGQKAEGRAEAGQALPSAFCPLPTPRIHRS